MGRAEIEPAGHSDVITQPPVIDAAVSGSVGMKQAADAQVLFDQSRIGYVNAVYDGFLAVAEVERQLGEATDPPRSAPTSQREEPSND